MITIEVNVYGGVAPTHISTTIKEKNNNYNDGFDKNGSFIESFDPPKGTYNIVVSGENPYNPNNDPTIRTEIRVYGDTTSGSINLIKVKTVDQYSAGFSFSI